MREVNVVGYDELPDWVDRKRLSGNGIGKEYANYLLIIDGDYRACYSDAMEPEDCTFRQDLSWIKNEISRIIKSPAPEQR